MENPVLPVSVNTVTISEEYLPDPLRAAEVNFETYVVRVHCAAHPIVIILITLIVSEREVCLVA